MRRMFVVIACLSILAGCDLLNGSAQFIGTWSGSNSLYGAVTYTFNADKTFTCSSGNAGTWDVADQSLSFLYSNGTPTRCDYVFSTFNGKAELELIWSNCTEIMLKQ